LHERSTSKAKENQRLNAIYKAISDKVKMLHVMGNKVYEKDKRLKQFDQELKLK
jgi:hypothetical protein